MKRLPAFAIVLFLSSCAHREAAGVSSAPRVVSLPLPGANGQPVRMDYLAYDGAKDRVWVPAGNTGRVDVIDAKSGELHAIEGFPTAERQREGKTIVVGPSSVSIGDGLAYVGNRADFAVCEVSTDTLTKGACAKLSGMPDGVVYVAATHEVWVTTPSEHALVVLDASSKGALTVKATVTVEGEPEGYAVDDAGGILYTNLEDKDRTLSIDVRAKKVSHDWPAGCGEDGPRGLAIDPSREILFVACPTRIASHDLKRDDAEISSLDAGAGVDNLDFSPTLHELFAAGGKSATLTVAKVDETGHLTLDRTVPTSQGARNAVVSKDGDAFVANTPGGSVLRVTR
ncbi:MAG: YncE family protein [Myxococcaceae bacterium]